MATENPFESEESAPIHFSEEQFKQIIDECERRFGVQRAIDRQNYLKERPWLQNMKK